MSTEDLSRLLSGDLPEAEAAELLDRIANDDELAADWEAMQALPDQLAGLPDLAPPPELNEQLLRPRFRWQSWAGWAVAAALVIALVMPRTEPTYTLLEGEQLVEGPALLHVADDAVVDVRGVAKISVEPSPTPLRDGSVKEVHMDKKLLIAAATGAAITVTVLEGKAFIERGGDTTTLEAGDVEVFGGIEAAEAAPRVTRTAPEITVSEADERIEELERELEKAKFEKALVEGRVMAHEGVEHPFPDDLDLRYTPEGYPEAIQQAVLANGEGELVDVDCSEFPCMATLTIDTDEEDWGELLEPVADAMKSGGDDKIWINASTFGGVDGEDHFWTVVVLPLDHWEDEDLSTRTKWRTDQKVDEMSERVRAGEF